MCPRVYVSAWPCVWAQDGKEGVQVSHQTEGVILCRNTQPPLLFRDLEEVWSGQSVFCRGRWKRINLHNWIKTQSQGTLEAVLRGLDLTTRATNSQ